ncbi:MAG: hypothetical protein JO148_06660 [Acidimicrobiia bacterium]|nr:hypothetical protein [Acidimicrobiia bacterium]
MKTRGVGAAVAAVALAMTATVGLATTGQAASPTSDPAKAAQLGGGWLARQAQSDGSFQLLSNTYSDTATAALALGASGVGGSQFTAAVAYLHDHVSDFLTSGGTDDPGTLGLAIMAVVAGGQDPTNFNGHDLVATLKATRDKKAPGLYGSKDPSFDGTTRQSLGLMGLAAAGSTDAPALQWLETQQCPDKGWQAYRSDTSAPCQPTDLANFAGEDTNSTAVAVEALKAQHATAPRGNPLDWLKGAQNTDGGFGVLVGNATDANSTGLVAQAIVAGGETPTQGRWTTANGADPETALLALQIGCAGAAADRGAFAFQPDTSGNLKANGFATAQAVPGAAAVPFPLAASTPAATAPTVDCSPATTTTTSAPTGSTTTTPVASTTASNVGAVQSTATPTPVASAVAATPTFTG